MDADMGERVCGNKGHIEVNENTEIMEYKDNEGFIKVKVNRGVLYLQDNKGHVEVKENKGIIHIRGNKGITKVNENKKQVHFSGNQGIISIDWNSGTSHFSGRNEGHIFIYGPGKTMPDTTHNTSAIIYKCQQPATDLNSPEAQIALKNAGRFVMGQCFVNSVIGPGGFLSLGHCGPANATHPPQPHPCAHQGHPCPHQGQHPRPHQGHPNPQQGPNPRPQQEGQRPSTSQQGQRNRVDTPD